MFTQKELFETGRLTTGMKRIAILQSNYIPWKGYFDMMSLVDEFVIFDEAQFTKNDWRNRNKIPTEQGLQWLSIPVFHSTSQRINEIKISDPGWNRRHWNTIRHCYARAKYFKQYRDFFEELYMSRNEQYLSEINLAFIRAINKLLNISTAISFSTSYTLEGNRNERLVNIIKQAGASEYITGPAARDYLDVDLFESERIKVTWMDYSKYPEYEQLVTPFEHAVSVVDVIFNTGPAAEQMIKSKRT